MSEFKVQLVKVDDVVKHPDADKLTIVKIGGYDCISSYLDDGSLRYKPGDAVVYVPEGAVVPDWMLQKLGMYNAEKNKGILAGSAGNRVKAIKLRGVISQGILYPATLIERLDGSTDEPQYLVKKPEDQKAFSIGDCVAEFLGIHKYEAPIPTQLAGKVGSLFGYTKSYDIENLQKYPNVFEHGELVVMTEKLHGTLCQIGFLTNLPEDKRGDCIEIVPDLLYAYVTSKGLAGKGLIQKNDDDNKNNLYVQVLNQVVNNKDAIDAILDIYSGDFTNNLYMFGEIFGKGVQDLHYGTNSPEFRVFDIYSLDIPSGKGGYFNNLELTNFCIRAKLLRVPMLYVGPFSKETADEYRVGHTVAGNGMHIREGIVIRPHIEREHRGLPDNRAQLKYVSPDYLLRKDGTEHQ